MLKRFLLIFLPTAILLACLLGFIYKLELKSETTLLEARELENVKMQSMFIDSYFYTIIADLEVISGSHELKQLADNSDNFSSPDLINDLITISKRTGVFDQIRFIDNNGMEKIRVDYNDGKPSVTQESELQDKSDRYYFTESIRLPEGSVYMSRLDLNVEHGKVEQPPKPMIRFATPVYGNQESAKGVLVMNAIAKKMLSPFKSGTADSLGDYYSLLNNDGYWLAGPVPEDEFGFQSDLGKEKTFSRDYPDAWKKIAGEETGQFHSHGVLFTFTTYHPLQAIAGRYTVHDQRLITGGSSDKKNGERYNWKIVSYPPMEVLYEKARLKPGDIINNLTNFYFGLLLLLGAGALSISKSISNRKVMERELIRKEETLRLTLDASTDGAWEWDFSTGEIIYSDKWIESLGYKRDEIESGRNFWETIVHPDHKERIKEAIRNHLAGKNEFLESECLLRKGTGEYRWNLTRGRVIERDKDGKPLRMVGASTDISKRKEAERVLRLSHFSVENTTDTILWANRDGAIINVNDQASALLGYTREELTTMSVFHIDPGLTKEHWDKEWRRLREVKTIHIFVNHRAKDGREFPVEVTANYLVFEGKEFNCAFVKNITERKKIEEELENYRERLEERVEERTAQVQKRDEIISLIRDIAIKANDAKSVDEALKYCLDQICDLAGWEVGHVYLVSEKNLDELIPTSIWSMKEQSRLHTLRSVTMETRFARGVGLPGRVLESGRTEWIPDITRDQNFPRAKSSKELGVRAAFAFPVFVKEKVVAVLEFFSSEISEPDERLISIVTQIGTQISRVLERKKAEQKINEAMEFQGKIVTESPIGMSIFDESGDCVLVNDAMAQIIGGTKEELMLRNYNTITEWKVSGLLDKALLAVKENEVKHHDFHVKTSFGREIALECFLVPFSSEGKRNLLVMANDIGERKEMEMALISARNIAERTNRAKSTFLSSMSHELRTPLNSILGFSQLLDSDKVEPLSKAQSGSVKRILKAGAHLLDLIDEVLDLSKIESQEISVEISDIAVAPLISDVIQSIETLANKHQIRIIHQKEDEKYFIQADRTRFRQVMLNLLTNAIKYNRKNGEVRIYCEKPADNRLRINIGDTGYGIANEKLAILFEPFTRLGMEGSGIEGTGIGLTITKKLVEMMGGSIGVESKIYEGTRFYIDFPLIGKGKPRPQSADVQEINRAYKRNIKTKVIYIEDNESNFELVQTILERFSGITLFPARTGKEGLETIHKEKPDIILLDINLPDTSGYEVFRKLKSDDETKNVPVVAISANAMAEDIANGKRAGFAHYVTKPIDINRFVNIIDNLIQ